MTLNFHKFAINCISFLNLLIIQSNLNSRLYTPSLSIIAYIKNLIKVFLEMAPKLKILLVCYFLSFNFKFEIKRGIEIHYFN